MQQSIKNKIEKKMKKKMPESKCKKMFWDSLHIRTCEGFMPPLTKLVRPLVPKNNKNPMNPMNPMLPAMHVPT
jgi:hypothetical protein